MKTLCFFDRFKPTHFYNSFLQVLPEEDLFNVRRISDLKDATSLISALFVRVESQQIIGCNHLFLPKSKAF